MKSRTAAALLLPLVIAGALVALVTRQGAAPHTLILVRHAERADASEDTLLSPTGEARAAHLADVLGGLGVRTIYVTEYRRTQQTAQPLAQRLGLVPVVVAAKDSAGLLQRLRRERSPVLVVGHGNTVPGLLTELGVREAVQIPQDQFQDLYVVVTHRWGPPTLLQLRY